MSSRGQALSVLIVSTLAFTVCFMVWMMFGVIGIPIRKTLDLNATEFGLLTATPVLTGSLIRVPLGMWTDKFGGRIVFFVLMLLCVVPIFLIAHATQFWQYLVLGLFVGLAGGSFSVGTPYVARWFPRNRQGFAMGIFGAGNSGAAVNKFVAPALVVAFGWVIVPQVYAAIMFGTALLFWFCSYSDPSIGDGRHERFAVGGNQSSGKGAPYNVLFILVDQERFFRPGELPTGFLLPGHERLMNFPWINSMSTEVATVGDTP